MDQEAQAQEVESQEVESQEVETQSTPARDYESEALKMGWIPQNKFRGDPEKWTDAETFVRRGEEYLPFIKAQNRDLEEKASTLEKKISDYDRQMKEMAKHLNKAEEVGYKKAVEEYKEMQKRAFQQGDEDAFNLATEKLDELSKEKPKKVIEIEEKDEKPEPIITSDQKELLDWHRDNPWFEKDQEMTAYAVSIANFINSTRPNISSNREYYDTVTEYVKKQFPDRFENKKQRAPSDVVEAPTGGKAVKKRSFERLPPEAQAACKRFMAASNNPEAVKKSYVDNYDWGE